MNIHEWAAEGFARGAAAYEEGRPGYPAAAVTHLVGRLRLQRGATVVDVAAGTGKLSRLLVPSGARVIAVEPVDAMRELVPAAVETVAGTAENLPLDAASADAIAVAQAFHWFRADQALREFHRVLRPGGALALVRNGRDVGDPVQREFEELLGRHRAHRRLEPDLDVESTLARSGLFAPAERRLFRHEHELDRQALVAQAASESSIALLSGDAYDAALSEFRRFAERLPPRIALRYETEVVVSERRPRGR